VLGKIVAIIAMI